MEILAGILPTLLWVLLIAGIVWRFNSPIHSLLNAIAKRLEAGAALKFGRFEIGELTTPQLPEEQKARLQAEVQEIIRTTPIEMQADTKASLQSMYIQAEELALRAIQAEYGSSVQRQASLGHGVNVDGIIKIKNDITIIEVKYTIHKISLDVVKNAITQLRGYRDSVPRIKDAKFILALVHDQAEPGISEVVIREQAHKADIDLDIKLYSFRELASRFGVDE